MKIEPESYREEGEGIYYVGSDVVKFSSEDICFLKERVRFCSKKRNRICSHLAKDDQLHEMLICVMAGSYIAPAKHTSRAESLHVIEGLADIVFFDEGGKASKVIQLTEPALSGNFYYRMNSEIYHMLMVRSEFFVFHEVTTGPFDRSSTVQPNWAPAENNPQEIADFLEEVEEAIEKLSD